MRKTGGLLKLIGLCVLAGVLLAGVLFPVAGAAGVLSNQASETVDKTSSALADLPPPLVTRITDSGGNQIALLYDQYRLPITPEQINEAMRWALVSIEDRRYYDHHGVDWKGTLRAAVSNSTGAVTQGASTLTQQYVKNYLINVVYRTNKVGQQKAQEVSVARKLQEARIAIQLETKLSKAEILAGYLNIVEFSRQIYGIAAAAQAYFDTTPEKLTVPQAALLAGLVNNPAANDPWKYADKAVARRNLVLDRMVENQKLAPADAETFKAQPLGVVEGGPKKPAANCVGAGPEAGFYCQYVEDYLIKSGMSRDDLYTGGYTIKTTLDQKANHEAKISAQTQVDKTQPNVANTLSLVRPGKDRHEVVALAANRDYGTDATKGQTIYALPSGVWNVTGAGSSYKIFTAAAALQQGVAGIQTSIDTPENYVSNLFGGGRRECGLAPQRNLGYRYCLGNSGEGNYPGSMSLQNALATSPNTGFVILEEKIGMGPVVEMASKLGLRETMASNQARGEKPDPASKDNEERLNQSQFFGPAQNSPGLGSFTLGVSPTSGLELANVAATIMSGGTWCPPTPIRQVTDRYGNAKSITETPCGQVVDEGLANTLAVGMSKDDTVGTARAAAADVGWNRPMIGKTGTTQNSSSATFIGATSQLAGVAMTFKFGGGQGGICDSGPGAVSICRAGGNIFGGKAPARTWFAAMTKILESEPIAALPVADPRYERVGQR